MGFGVIDYVVMAAYLSAIIAMGFFFMRKQENTEEYYLGGRRFHWVPVAISLYVTLFSAISFIADPGEVTAPHARGRGPVTVSVLRTDHGAADDDVELEAVEEEEEEEADDGPVFGDVPTHHSKPDGSTVKPRPRRKRKRKS